MRREFALRGVSRGAEHPVRSIACLGFVLALGAAFWAGALYVGEIFLALTGRPF